MVFISSHLKIVGFPPGEYFQVYDDTKKMKDTLPMTEQRSGDIWISAGEWWARVQEVEFTIQI